MWRRFYFKPFEAFVGLFVIINGLLTLFPIADGGSAVKDNLWNLMGETGVLIPILQIIAGAMKIIGIATNKTNIESSGLIMVSTMFLVRAIGLTSDGNISNSDINNLVIAAGIVVSNCIRLSQVLNSHKYVVSESELKLGEIKT